MGQNSERYLEMLEETFTAEQHRNEQRIKINRTVQNKDADDAKTTELMISKSLEFEALREDLKQAKNLIGCLLVIIEDDTIGSLKAKAFPTADEQQNAKPSIHLMKAAMDFMNVRPSPKFESITKKIEL